MLLCFQEGKPNEDDPALHDFVLGVHSLQAQWLLDQYGDVLYLDATYSANKSQCPNFAILVVDSLNHGHLVAIFILLHENAADMQIALESLQKMAYPLQPKAVVMDKSDATRLTAKAVWPESKIVLCRWHALRAVEEFCRPQMQHHTALIKVSVILSHAIENPRRAGLSGGKSVFRGILSATSSEHFARR